MRSRSESCMTTWKDAHDPRGDLGAHVEHEIAWAMSQAMRAMMNQDKWEHELG